MPDWQISNYFGMGGIRRQLQKRLDVQFVLESDSGKKQTGLPYRLLVPDVNIFGKRPFRFISCA